MPKKKVNFDRKVFEHLLYKHHKTLPQLVSLHDKKVLDQNSFLYTLEEVIALCYRSFTGGWENRGKQQNPKSIHSNREGPRQGRKFIKNAFTK